MEIQHLLVFGDSMVVIQKVCKLKETFDLIEALVLHRIRLQLVKFESIDPFHVKRHLNMVVDSLANKGVCLEQGMMMDNCRVFNKPLP